MPDINQIVAKPGAERAILSIILRNRDRIVDCEGKGLFSEHFSVKANQYLYSVICYLSSQQDVRSIDSLLIYNTITDVEAKRVIDEIGGLRYIDALINSLIQDNLNIYINQVKQCALKRLAYQFGADIQNRILNTDESEDVEEIFGDIQTQVIELVLNNQSVQEVYHLGANALSRIQERINNPRRIAGYEIGWQQFDAATQGYKGNELTVYVAESKTGKSTLLLNHSKKLSIDFGIGGLYVDTEMTDEQQEDRMVSMISGVPYEEICNGMCNRDTEHGTGESKMLKIVQATETLNNSNLYHVYMPNFTIDKVSALVRKYQLQHNIGYLIFDYIKLPTSEIAGLANAQEYQRLGFITTCLKDIAGLCNIPVITAAQANRSNLGGTSQDASNIGGSYRILQMADKLIFLRNKTDFEISNEGFNQGNQKLTIKYQRSGACDVPDINIMFDRPTLRMVECSIN